MHGIELVGVDLDASARQFTSNRDGLEAALSELLLQRLFLDARHGSVAPEFHCASYRRQAPVLNGERRRSRCEPGVAPYGFLRVAIRGYGFRGLAGRRRVRLRPPNERPWGRLVFPAAAYLRKMT